ncbi:hypothetical protein Cni_G25538 [Canna indica]|uniref:Uncharacterized protein n=1 Tax=Canna indica TaxID=4628 RepID=A0AAQ3KY35_9LILI|nr:hypothetical protein Cni_G25538 [Canna indica]
MAKRILPLLNEESVGWVRLYKAKYGSSHPWGETNRRRTSEQYRVVLNCLANIREGLGIRIANGKKTKVWEDPWLFDIPLNVWPTFIDISELRKFDKVAELLGNVKGKIQKESAGEKITDKQGYLMVYCDAAWKWETSGYKTGRGFVVLKNGECLFEKNEIEYAADCEKALKMLKGELKTPWHLEGLKNRIWNVAMDISVVGWFHINRNCNLRARSLAIDALYRNVVFEERYNNSVNEDSLYVAEQNLYTGAGSVIKEWLTPALTNTSFHAFFIASRYSRTSLATSYGAQNPSVEVVDAEVTAVGVEEDGEGSSFPDEER